MSGSTETNGNERKAPIPVEVNGEPAYISARTRKRSMLELQYWNAIDHGDRILPPPVCRECAQVFEHHPRCIKNK